MAAATTNAMYQQNGAQSLALAFPQINGIVRNYDLFQIVAANGGAILLNVDYAGVVRKPAVNATTSANGSAGQVRIGRFLTRLTSSATVAQLFADAFTNFKNEDILQVINNGGNVSYWLDYLGVAHGS